MAGGAQGGGAPQQSTPQGGGGGQPPTIGATQQNQNFMTGPATTGNMPGGNMGFDRSGSDGGTGGQPAPMQTPFAPQGGASTYGGSTNPTPYQGSAAQQNLGQAGGPYGGSNPMGAMGQAQQNLGQNAQGQQSYMNNILAQAQQNYGGQLTPAQQNQITQNAGAQFGGQPQTTTIQAYDDRMPQGQNMTMENRQGPQAMGAMTTGPNIYGGGINPAAGGAQGYAHSGAMQYNPQGSMGGAPSPMPMGPNIYGGGINPAAGGAQSAPSQPPMPMGPTGGTTPTAAPQPPITDMGQKGRGIMAGRPAMDKGEIPPSLSQMRPQQKGLQVQGNPTAQPFMRKGRRTLG